MTGHVTTVAAWDDPPVVLDIKQKRIAQRALAILKDADEMAKDADQKNNPRYKEVVWRCIRYIELGDVDTALAMAQKIRTMMAGAVQLSGKNFSRPGWGFIHSV